VEEPEEGEVFPIVNFDVGHAVLERGFDCCRGGKRRGTLNDKFEKTVANREIKDCSGSGVGSTGWETGWSTAEIALCEVRVGTGEGIKAEIWCGKWAGNKVGCLRADRATVRRTASGASWHATGDQKLKANPLNLVILLNRHNIVIF
jgi:hypothetical protein